MGISGVGVYQGLSFKEPRLRKAAFLCAACHAGPKADPRDSHAPGGRDRLSAGGTEVRHAARRARCAPPPPDFFPLSRNQGFSCLGDKIFGSACSQFFFGSPLKFSAFQWSNLVGRLSRDCLKIQKHEFPASSVVGQRNKLGDRARLLCWLKKAHGA